MKTIVVLINGIALPYHVIDYAINLAKEKSAEIFVLFLKGKHEPLKGYGYPSDLPTTETWTSNKEALTDDELLIADNMKMVKQMVEDEKIPYRYAVKANASIEEVAEIIALADLIVIDENFDEESLLPDNKISVKTLKQKLFKPISVVHKTRENSI